MSKVLVVASIQKGRVKRSTFEAMTRARQVAESLGAELEAAVLAPNAGDLAPVMFKYGARTVHVLESDAFSAHLNRPVIEGLSRVIEASEPRIVVFASTEAVKDVLGALAVRANAAVLPDVATFDADHRQVTSTRPVMAAKKLAPTVSDEDLVFVSIRSGSYEAVEAAVEGTVNEIDFSFDLSTLSQTLREVVQPSGDGVDLSEARVVVAAGRGVRDEEGKQLVEDLADIFGAGIGASRAVVENGLFPASAQIGQTGKVVSPDLYFAIGISGAIQHVAGMANSRVIVAINKDGDAPIFDLSTYGLVGDLYNILPPLIDKLRGV